MFERKRFEEGWTTLLILLAMTGLAAYGISQSDFFTGLAIVPPMAIAGVLTGTIIAKSRFSPRTAIIYAIIFALFTTIYGVAAMLPGDLVWRERVLEVIIQQVEFIQKLVSGGTNREGFIFVFHASLAVWSASYAAAWYTFRTPRIWRAIIPPGLILFSVVYYYAGPRPMVLYMIGYMLLSLLFVARTYLMEQELDWRRSAVRYEQHIWLNFMRAGLIASVFSLMLAWSIPTLSASAAVGDALSDARGPWRQFQDNWTRMYSALRTYGETTIDPYQDSLVLGGPRVVGDTPVMDIYVDRELPYVYWQTIVYDTYADGSWRTARYPETLHITDEGLLDTPFTVSRQVITQTVVNYLPNSSLLYGAPEMIGSDRDMFVEAGDDGSGNRLITHLRSRYVLKQGDQYDVISRYSVADATSLRLASEQYPAWVTNAYLQVPEDISERTVRLAAEITAPHSNNFDKAIAVRDYLRANIAYNDQIDAPPADVDPVDYTLFVSKEGYCNYYASAMAMMLRSQGIPTRVASGYAQGEFNDDGSFYRVRASNAHTWVEVYFPDYGWIQFEPTSAIPVVDRPEQTDGGGGDAFESFLAAQEQLNQDELLEQDEVEELDPSALGDLRQDEALDAAGQSSTADFWETFPVWQALTAVIVALIALALSLLANNYNQQIEQDVTRSYGRLGSWGRWLGVRVRPVHTPYEQADLLSTAVPAGKEPIHNLVAQFVRQQFSPDRTPEADFDAQAEWKTLRPLMLRQTASHWLKTVRQRLSRKR